VQGLGRGSFDNPNPSELLGAWDPRDWTGVIVPFFALVLCYCSIPVVPHKAVAEVSE